MAFCKKLILIAALSIFFVHSYKAQAYNACDFDTMNLPCSYTENGITYDYDSYIISCSNNSTENCTFGYLRKAFFDFSATELTYHNCVTELNEQSTCVGVGVNSPDKYLFYQKYSGWSEGDLGLIEFTSFNTGSSNYEMKSYSNSILGDSSSDYSLQVVYPTLNENQFAQVQPNNDFHIKVSYVAPPIEEDSLNFYAFQCLNTDCDNQGNLIAFGSLSSMKNELKDNAIIFNAPITLDETDEFRIGITTLTAEQFADAEHFPPTTQNTPSVRYFFIKGVNDSSLPIGDVNSAINNSGGSQDFGFWGNIVRDIFVPSSYFINTELSSLQSEFSDKFPGLATMQNTLNSNVNNLTLASSTYNSPTLSLFGSSSISIMDTSKLDPYIGQVKAWVSMFLWFYCFIFCFKSIRNLLHPTNLSAQ